MVHQPETMLAGDGFLQGFDFGAVKLDDPPRRHIEQMVMMVVRRGFVARLALAEIVTLDDTRILEQRHGAIDGGDRDIGIDRGCAAVDLLGIGMVGGGVEHPGNDAPLAGHPHALVGAHPFQRHCRFPVHRLAVRGGREP